MMKIEDRISLNQGVMSACKDTTPIAGFDWDKGNLEKNWIRHGVTNGRSDKIVIRG